MTREELIERVKGVRRESWAKRNKTEEEMNVMADNFIDFVLGASRTSSSSAPSSPSSSSNPAA